MRARTFARLGTALAGAAISALAFAGTAQAASGTIMVPDDFNPAYSDTRATGHYEVQGTGLRIWTEGTTSTDKVAEYVDTSTPLADVGEPSLELHAHLGRRSRPASSSSSTSTTTAPTTASWSASRPTTATTGG